MKMNQKTAVLLLIALLFMSFLFNSNLVAANEMFQITSLGRNYTEIEFTLKDYEFIDTEVDGTVYKRLYHPESGFLMEEGLPEVLTFSVILAIPETGTVELESPRITDSNILSDVLLFPSQGFDFDISEEEGFLIDHSFYVKDIDYPLHEAQVTTPAIMRDMRLVSVTLYPFSYNPALRELTVRNRISLRVNYNPDLTGENEITRSPRLFSHSFEKMYQGSILNYHQFRDPDREYQARSMIVVHNHNTTIVNLVNEFVNWKRNKGFEVTAISTAMYSSNTAIKNYIQNAYNTWENPPEYVVLIGAASGSINVPAWNVNSGWGDHPYTLLEGNDDLADLFIGRIAIDNSTQLATIWNKISNYERTPYLDNTDWYERNLLVGDPGSSGVSTIITNKYLKEIMLRHNSDYSFIEVYNSPFASQMNAGVNQGVSIFNYRGYIGMSSWSPNDASLYNGLMLPNCAFLTCSTLSYTTSGSKTDYMVRMGTPTGAKGGVTAIGMTTSATKTAFNNCLGGGIFYGIFVEDMRTMGEALARGQLYLWQVYGNSHPSQPPLFSQWANLIGDPSMDIWVEQPKPLTVDYNNTIPLGSNSVVVSVSDSFGQPVSDAWVTIRQGDDVIFATGYTDTSGNITLFFDPESDGTINLTVTKPNYIPYLSEISIAGNPGVTFNDTVVNDDVVAGTTVNFALMVKNHSSQSFNGVTGIISTESDYVNITSTTSLFGNVAPGAIVESTTDYTIVISPDTPSNHKAIFLLTTSDNLANQWTSRFYFTILNGNLVPQSIVVNDGGNGILDPGEQVQLLVHLKNAGLSNLTGVQGILRGGGQGFAIIDSTAFFGDIAPDQTVTSTGDHFYVSAASYVTPGSSFDMELALFNNQGFTQTRIISLTVGVVTIDDPLGPDSYGYWCYDYGDTDYLDAPVYEWIEIYPPLGGSGTNTNLTSDHNNNQNVMNMNLPFTFRFYGVDYDQISICANGWVAFGITEQATFRNWRLPGPLGPSSIIAAFWDNLAVSTASGGVYTYYDNAQSIFIIQWQNAQNIVGNAQETFQIILYDPMYYYTLTGDGPIKIQYKVFNNVNNGTGYPYGNWGNYSTIGIADHSCTVGLEYSFNNQYPTAARPLGNETALYFTTGSVDYENAFVAIETFSITDDNNNIPEYGETVGINITLVNLGGEEAGNVSAQLTTNDPFITILDNQATFGTIVEEESSTVNNAFTIEIADNIPHMHRVVFILYLSADGDMNWTHTFNLDINAPDLTPLQPIIYDPHPEGNNNGLIDPGETLILYLPIKNIGGSESPSVTTNITSDHPLVTINSISDNNFNSVKPGEVMYPALNITIDDNITIGTEIIFSYSMQTGSYQFSGQAYTNVGGLVTVQLGSGTAVNSNTDGAPINIWYRSLRGQMVYTAAELNAAGINGPGAIMEFGFYVTSPPIYPLPNFIIRMKHTTATNAASHDNGPFTTVYSPQNYDPVAGGWDMLTLTTPFQWNGIDNILVDTAFAQVPSWNSSGQLRVTNVPNGYRFVRADTSDQTNSTTTTASSNKPHAQMVFVTSTGDTEITRPENLTAQFISSQIFLQWDPPPTPDNREQQISLSRNNDIRESSSTRQRTENRFNYTRDERDPLGYNVYRNGVQINGDLVQVTEYYDANVEPLVNYYYYVTALYPEGESAPSNIVSIELANRVSTPEFIPPAGYYNTAQSIEITTETEDTLIYYTLDGTEPNENSTLYDLPIALPLGTEIVIKAKGFREDLLESETGIAEYFITQTIPTPLIYPEEGVYLESQEISISLPYDTWNIYYTLDGTEPSASSSIYTDPFMIDVSITIKAKGIADGWIPSETAITHLIILNPPHNLTAETTAANVMLNWDEPLLPDNRSKISNSRLRNNINRNRDNRSQDLLGYNIYRAFNNGQFNIINETPVIENSYYDTGLAPGNYQYYVTALYQEGESLATNTVSVIVEDFVANPEFDPEPGIYEEPIDVSIICNTDNAIIYYTLDGNDPDTNSTLYEEPIFIEETTTIKAIATLQGWQNSEIVTAVYTIDTSSVDDDLSPIFVTELLNAYPNPFNPSSTFSFTLKEHSQVTLEIYNIAGKKVITLINDSLDKGKHTIHWQGEDEQRKKISSGIYFYRLKTADYQAIKKIVLLK
ncbi:MAG: chitobiase/beta-hexosaminidase C-terminal domain-containing protein [Candidatus Cloacimonetes bacterium]|nr:chitobiase/beta-hexosaminidase C-terminal domain-containing protein [Candidatus Cloacimonadota bacterium]